MEHDTYVLQLLSDISYDIRRWSVEEIAEDLREMSTVSLADYSASELEALVINWIEGARV